MGNYVPVLVAAGVSIVTALVTVLASRPKVRADVTKTLTDISLSLVEPQAARIDVLQTKVAELTCDIKKLYEENRSLHKWSQLLFSQVIEHGGDPISFDRSEQLRKEQR